jgi:hypothetical protein
MIIEHILYLIEQVESKIPLEKRELNNLPRYSTGKPKVKFQEWLGMKTETGSIGKSKNGKWYGWSHRAIHGFYPGEEIKANDAIGRDMSRKIPYKIKDDQDAKEHAKRFADDVA